MSKSIYLDLVKAISKMEPSKPNLVLLRHINYTIGKHEQNHINIFKNIIKSSLKRFARKLDNKMFEKVFKSQDSDLKAQLKKMMIDSFGASAIDEYSDTFNIFMEEMIKGIATSANVEIDYNLVNKKATGWLRSNAENLFSTMSDSQADGIFNAIATKMEDTEAGYTLRTIVDGIKSAIGDEIYLPNQKLSLDQYAELVGRTETARCASASSQIVADELGLKTWQWCAQDSACDECDSNADQIVMIGDEFNSGDTESPSHCNCRCVCVFVASEISGIQNDLEAEDSPESS